MNVWKFFKLIFFVMMVSFVSCKAREEAQLASEDVGTEVFTLKGHRVFRFVCVGGEVAPNCKDWDFQELDELLESHADYAAYKIVAPAMRDIESATKDIANVKAAMEKETRPFQKKGMQARIDVQEKELVKLRDVVKANPKGEDLYAILDGIRESFYYPRQQSYQKIAGILKRFQGRDWSRYLDSSSNHSCALSAGYTKPKCWGNNISGQAESHNGMVKLSMLPLIMISSGDFHTCALTNKGEPICWGDNRFGQTDGHNEKVKSGMLPLKKLSSGDYHACALSNRREPICWGDNEFGQTESHKEEVKPEMIPLRMIDSGLYHTCALSDRGEPVCWGNNEYGQTDGHKEKVKPGMLPLKMISSGSRHTCTLTNKGEPICWGSNEFGQTEGHKDKVKLGMLPLRMISSGSRHTCTLTNKGEPICWGENLDGKTDASKAKPEMLPSKMITAGDKHTCALTALGKPICWGSDSFGQVTGRSPEGYKLGLNVPEDVDLSFEAFYYGDN